MAEPVSIGIYFPLIDVVLSVTHLMSTARRRIFRDEPNRQMARRAVACLVIFSFVGLTFFAKGIFRVSVSRMMMSIIPSNIALCALIMLWSRSG